MSKKRDSVIEYLQRWAMEKPDQVAYFFLVDNSGTPEKITYKQLFLKSSAIANFLKGHTAKGDRVVLLYPQGIEYICSFWACLLAGVVAVPAFPPRSKRQAPRVEGIIQDTSPHFLMTTSEQCEKLKKIVTRQKSDSWEWLNTDLIDSSVDEMTQVFDVGKDDLAFLQYTSGSTGTPKGVMVSHGNLLCNELMIEKIFSHTEDLVSVTWLPLFHDMGLVGGMIHPAFKGGTCVIMSPMNFMQKPISWLRAVSNHKGTTTGAPNFAFDLCADAISEEEKKGLDLSSLEIVFNGSEPVRSDSLKRFYNAFKDYGLRKEAIFPCYGMAETTLIVTGAGKLKGYVENNFDKQEFESSKVKITNSQQFNCLVSSGTSACEFQKILVVDPETSKELIEGSIGEIWVSGDHVAKGYWNKPELTELTFGNRVSEHNERFLRTGDLGFFLNNELYVTGRIKDVIIINGSNYYPQDIEKASEESHESFRRSGVAAFSVEEDGREKVIVCQELERSACRDANIDELSEIISNAIWENCDLSVDEIVLLKPARIPKTSSGKVQRSRCKQEYLTGEQQAIGTWSPIKQVVEVKKNNEEAVDAALQLKSWLVEQVAKLSGVSHELIDSSKPFSNYGLGSLEAVRLTGMINDRTGKNLSPTAAYDFPTINELINHLFHAETVDFKRQNETFEDIAVIAAECNFPGAPNLDLFSELLFEGRSGIGLIPENRWDVNAFYDADSAPGKMNIRHGGFLKNVDLFDNSFFEISPEEARMMDPQQRLLLETAWRTLERSNKIQELLNREEVGVFVGISNSDYSRNTLSSVDELGAYVNSGNAFSIAANRLSYFFNWKGPSLAIDTACSSSLVSIHQACKSLQANECDYALAGGVNLILRPELNIAFSQAQMMAPDGLCKTFDAQADGYVRSEGCGLILLKKLEKAEADGDKILGVIKGSALNQDGRSNGLTAPNSQAQKKVIHKAIAVSGLKTEDISYVECHGTGTSLGDPIEVNVLHDIFKNGKLHIGSVKASIGHLESAAGIAGFLKTLICLERKAIPSQLNFNELNPAINLGSSLKIPLENTKWENSKRIAGISSFSFGGSNAHLILEEYNNVPHDTSSLDNEPLMLCFSAQDKQSLLEKAKDYKKALEKAESAADFCYAAYHHRSVLSHRVVLHGENRSEILKHLQNFIEEKPATNLFENSSQSQAGSLAFLCTGQGSQYASMGAELYQKNEIFKKELDKCAEILNKLGNFDLLKCMFDKNNQLLDDTRYTQPTLFVLEYSICKLWESKGIKPDALIGHSLGEYVAACLAEVFSLEDALKLIFHRASGMANLPHAGSMAAILCTPEEIETYLNKFEGKLSIAAKNGPENIVVSGDTDSLESLLNCLPDDVQKRKLKVSHAFHSYLMEPMLDEYKSVLETITFHRPKTKFISNLTGKFAGEEVCTTAYWLKHIRHTVDFTAGVETLLKNGFRTFLETGPRTLLRALVEQTNEMGNAYNIRTISSLEKYKKDSQQFRSAVAQLFCSGFDIRQFIPGKYNSSLLLPMTPFNRKRFWCHSTIPQTSRIPGNLYKYVWEEIGENTPEQPNAEAHWIILSTGSELQKRICQRLNELEQRYDIYHEGDALPTHFSESQIIILCLWPFEESSSKNGLEYCAGIKFSSFLRKFLPKSQEIRLMAVTQKGALHNDDDYMFDAVESTSNSHAFVAYWKGLLQENPSWNGCLIDLEKESDGAPSKIIQLATSQSHISQVVFRNGKKYTPLCTPLENVESYASFMQGTYIICGAFGGIGRSLVKYFFQKGIKHFIFISRSELPSKKSWQDIKDENLLDKVRFVQELEKKGVEVFFVQADISDKKRLKEAFELVSRKQMPELKGIVHSAGTSVLESAESLTEETFEKTVQAKVQGAWNLHQLSLDFNIDTFLLCSSAAGFLGAPGQVFYGAANASLDALATIRKNLGLSALSVNWGPWFDKGIYRSQLDDGGQSLLLEAGINSLRSEQYIELLERAFSTNEARVLAVDVNWNKYLSCIPDTLAYPYKNLVTEHKTKEIKNSFVQALKKLTAPEREVKLKKCILEELNMVLKNEVNFDFEAPFDSLGMESLTAIEFKNRIQKVLGVAIPVTATYNYPNINSLSKYLLQEVLKFGEVPEQGKKYISQNDKRDDIAIIGMSCRFPGDIDSPEKFWQLLTENKDAISVVPKERWDMNEFYDSEPATPGKIYSQYGCFVKNVDKFDASFFQMSAREARAMDPQHRLFLETSWQAFENAAIPPNSLKGKSCGIFVGIGQNDYLNRKRTLDEIGVYDGTGNGFCFAAGRLSYLLGLRGPTMSIDTACSSSLTAMHLACQSLNNGESEVALAAGVQLMLSPEAAVFLSQSRALTAGKVSRVFDADADGFLRGEGCGVVVLKKLSEAQRDGDLIQAVIKSSAVNHDGHSRGLTVPSGLAQKELLELSLAQAHLNPEDIGLVEAHGTGTSLGDPIEVEALRKVYGSANRQPLEIRSVKASIGHLEAASGVASVIKAVLSMQHRKIPGQLHFKKPNPHISWDKQISVKNENMPWPQSNSPKRAAVSAFGLSGSNAHLILEEAPEMKMPQLRQWGTAILVLSAKSKRSLEQRAQSLISQIHDQQPNIYNLCVSVNSGYELMSHRLIVSVKNVDELVEKLSRFLEGDLSIYCDHSDKNERVRLSFAFTGQGAQYPGMGKELYSTEPVFREILDTCQELLSDDLDVPLLDVMFKEENKNLLNQTLYTQPALFALEYALAKLWDSWGIKPDVLIGHSVGEIAAACYAGVMSLEDGIKLISHRARLINSLPAGGGMTAVFSKVSVCERLIEKYKSLSIAAYNGPELQAVAGSISELEDLSIELKKESIGFKELAVSHAFHSVLMDPILKEFRNVIEGIAYNPPKIPIVSNVTGKLKDDEFSTDYWVEHIRASVQFDLSMKVLASCGDALLEIGPKPTLSLMGRKCIERSQFEFLHSLNEKEPDCLYQALKKVCSLGLKVNWSKFYQSKFRSFRLKNYPFDRKSYWNEHQQQAAKASSYEVVWQTLKELHSSYSKDLEHIVVHGGGKEQVVEALEKRGLTASVYTGNSVLLPQSSTLLVLSMYENTDDITELVKKNTFETARIISELNSTGNLKTVITLTQGAKCINGSGCDDVHQLAQSCVWGLWRGLSLDYSNIKHFIFDLDPNETVNDQIKRVFENINLAETQLAFRNGNVYCPKLKSLDYPKNIFTKKSNGTYLITGGLGGLGLKMADWLSDAGAETLILSSRKSVSGVGSLSKVKQLQDKGIKVHLVQMDLKSKESVDKAFNFIDQHIGCLSGIIHAAGAVLEGSVEELNEDDFWQMVIPKTYGSWLLHQKSLQYDLDVFLNFSSISSITGSKRLAYYAASNAFLDSFTEFRNQKGLVTKAVNWGPWSDTGMMTAVQNQRTELNSEGIIPIPSESYKEDFFHFLYSESSKAVIAHIRWQRFLPLIEMSGMNAFYSNFFLNDAPPEKVVSSTDWVSKFDNEFELKKFVEAEFVEQLKKSLQWTEGDIDQHVSFSSLGLDSMIGMELCEKISRRFEMKISGVSLFQYPTVAEMVEFITQSFLKVSKQPTKETQVENLTSSEPIAIIGLDCRFPGADSPDEFWDILANNMTSVKEVKRCSWLKSVNTAKAALLERPYHFDPLFFGMAPKEAEAIDPQQRLFMEVAWKALQQSGYGGERLCQNTGIFVGTEQSSYAEHYLGGQYFERITKQLQSNRFKNLTADLSQELIAMLNEELEPSKIVSEAAAGIGLNGIASRLSHFLNLKGPSLAVNSACSSSITALEQAVSQLRSGHIELAIVGGVNLSLSPSSQLFLEKAGALSPTGTCSPFDDSANGMVLGEGVGAVILKPLSQAQNDGDFIYSVIREVSINNDGHSQGITAPNPQGQADCIENAYKRSNIDPRTVSYIECHGTGTPLGDPIEIQSMTQAFRSFTNDNSFCKISSVKSTIGHMLGASGIGGLIKICLCFKNQLLPATYNYSDSNKHINFSNTPFSVVAKNEQWQSEGDQPRRAGLNAFGFGGTNGHVILEEAPNIPKPSQDFIPPVLLIHSKSLKDFPELALEMLNEIQKCEFPGQMIAVYNRNQKKQLHKLAIPIVSVDSLNDSLNRVINGDFTGCHQGKLHPKKTITLNWTSENLEFCQKEFSVIQQRFPQACRQLDLSNLPLSFSKLMEKFDVKFSSMNGKEDAYSGSSFENDKCDFKDDVDGAVQVEMNGKLTLQKLVDCLSLCASSGALVNLNSEWEILPQILAPTYSFSSKEYRLSDVEDTKPEKNEDQKNILLEMENWQNVLSNNFESLN